MSRRSKFSAETRERAVQLVFEQQDQHDSQWAAITSIAEMVGCHRETLRNWVRQAETDDGRRPGLTTDERERLTELERENRAIMCSAPLASRPPPRLRRCRLRGPDEASSGEVPVSAANDPSDRSRSGCPPR